MEDTAKDGSTSEDYTNSNEYYNLLMQQQLQHPPPPPQRQQQPPRLRRPPTPPPPPPIPDQCTPPFDGDGDDHIVSRGVAPPPPGSGVGNSQKPSRPRAGSLFRVGSFVTPRQHNHNHHHSHPPNSPKLRASNYNHVHDAVAINFREAAAAGNGGGGERSVPLGVAGLRNLGNTCFLNSSLQCLSATIPLTDYFLAYQYRKEINDMNPLGTGGRLVVAYAELLKAVWLGRCGCVVRPNTFKAQLERFAPQFRGGRQHDSQELLAYLLDGIHEDLNRINTKPYIEDRDCDGSSDEIDAIEAWKNYLRRDKSLIVDIFQGQMRSTLTCLTCRHTNTRFEPFMYLSLPMSAACRTISDCLELYLAQENMVGADQWYCGKCQAHRDATKKTDLWILPPILIVHLKRFSFNEYGQLGSKNNAEIYYPIQDWDLSHFVCSQGSEHPLYDCYAVSNHIGGLGGGHYTAYTQNRFNDQWYEFNDSAHRAVDSAELRRNSRSAYVLFYNRTNDNSNSADGGLSAASSPTSSASGRVPLIRRQSESRPDLWPHTQVRGRHFREFSRFSSRKLPSLPLDSSESASRG